MHEEEFRKEVRKGISLLFAEQPKFHGKDVPVSWHTNKDILNWLADNLSEGMATLETGSGYSTVIFALCRTKHIAISPAPSEHNRITEWCKEHGIGVQNLSFINSGSEAVLPNLQTDPLDVVFIDGRHAFPTPFIDWYYTAQRLKVGGYVIVDDTNLRACKILSEFLQQEKGRWKKCCQFLTSAIYQKQTSDTHAREWSYQPWGSEKLFSFKAKAVMFKDKLKNKIYIALGLRK